MLSTGQLGRVQFSKVAAETGIQEVKTAIATPNMSAITERFIGSVRRECLDHMLILSDTHTQCHQGIHQIILTAPDLAKLLLKVH